jgi:hypothetical protein
MPDTVPPLLSLASMLDDMRRYVRAGLEALSSQGGDDAADALLSRASGFAEQLSAFASGFLEWSAEARASLLQEVKDLVARQIEAMGVATKDDLETLRKRIDRLEAGAGAKTAPRRSSTGKAAARSSKATARKSTSKATARSSKAAARSGNRTGSRASGASRRSTSAKGAASTSSRSRRSNPSPE